MNQRNLLLAATLIGLLAAYFTYRYLEELRVKESRALPTVTIVVAKDTLTPKTILTDPMLEYKTIYKNDLPSGAVLKKEELIGKMVKETIYANEAVIQSRLVDDPCRAQQLSYQIPDGFRAITIQYTAVIGVGGFLVPGDHVDVIATFTKELLQTNSDQSKLILQDLLVLAVGKETQFGSTPCGTKETSNNGKKDELSTVTLAIKPDQAEKLTFAEERGSIRLLLRAVNDTKKVETSGADKTITAK